MNTFGLIGKKLSHSFSKNYFSEKFKNEGIRDSEYCLFEISDISYFPSIIEKYKPKGLNVTIPYKKEVMGYLDTYDESVKRIGAVNVIKPGNKIIGYNSDYFGFKVSLSKWFSKKNIKALVLGTGGASMAVKVALEDLEIPYLSVSRNSEKGLSYSVFEKHPELIQEHQLIINTTPLGMYPDISHMPPLPYQYLRSDHYLFDLVYNPETTMFMKKGLEAGANVKNGLEMLYLQAEKSWEIWNS